MTLDYRAQASLRKVLTGLYFMNADIVKIVQDVGLNPGMIAWDPKPENSWQAVLTEAKNQGVVQVLITRVRQDYPKVEQLELAEKGELNDIPTPVLSESEWQGPKEPGGLEKIIGAMSTLRPIGFLVRGYEVSRSVGRVVLANNGGTGSGFLVQGNILITNNHVLPDKDIARGAKVEFNYQKNALGLDEQVDAYDLDPDAGFVTSLKEEQGGDDWTAVKVKGDPAKWGTLTLVALPEDTPKANDEVIIIQHPGGGQKQIALSHNTVVYADKRRIQYLTDTLEGSSGSPVFDTSWRIVGLHYKGGWLKRPDTKKAVFSNQGIHINVVIKGLQDGGLL